MQCTKIRYNDALNDYLYNQRTYAKTIDYRKLITDN